MLVVENPVEFAHAKFTNLCAYLEATYGGKIDTSAMRAIPATALYVLLKQHLLPHAAFVRLGDLDSLISAIHEPRVAELAVLCKDDGKILRYLLLFCELVA